MTDLHCLDHLKLIVQSKAQLPVKTLLQEIALKQVFEWDSVRCKILGGWQLSSNFMFNSSED